MNDPMPKGGVKELLKSSDGRRYLARLQEKYKNDIVQPSTDPELFHNLYGNKIKRQQEVRERQIRDAKDQWAQLQDRKSYERKKKIFA